MRKLRNYGIAALLLAMTAPASGGTGLPPLAIAACMSPGGNAAVVFRAQAIAARVFADVGVALTWTGLRTPQGSGNDTGGDTCIPITLAERTPASEKPGSLAYARPFGTAGIVVFYDRVRETVWPSLTAQLLAYVFVHEIAHIVQGVEEHAAIGVMKSRWTYNDYVDMARGGLAFTPGDVAMIGRGLTVRIAQRPRALSKYVTVEDGEAFETESR